MKPPYYAVIFSSQRFAEDREAYEKMASEITELAKTQKGFLAVDSARDANGFGITVSYWESEADIKVWKANTRHLEAQQLGRSDWYESFTTRVCKVERQYGK